MGRTWANTRWREGGESILSRSDELREGGNSEAGKSSGHRGGHSQLSNLKETSLKASLRGGGDPTSIDSKSGDFFTRSGCNFVF